jgi:hypothetical protein
MVFQFIGRTRAMPSDGTLRAKRNPTQVSRRPSGLPWRSAERHSAAGFGQSVTLTATVKNMSAVIGVPDGNVTFLDGTTVLGTGKLRGGKANVVNP